MPQSLQNVVREPNGTQAAIRQALMSFLGLHMTWVVVESEDDVAVYEKFMSLDSTVVKTSESENGRKGYANVEVIVREIKAEEPRAHIMGIRDADYSRFDEGYEVPRNIFLTDCRDLEMMLLKSESVKQSLHDWAPTYDTVFDKCIPICRHFGYLRIYNSLNCLSVIFHNKLNPGKYWDYKKHDFVVTWEQDSTDKFMSLAKGECSVDAFYEFITTHSLEKGDFFDICRGHDFIPILSKALVREHIYSEEQIMLKMIEAYSIDDFKMTRLYANIQLWQHKEEVTVLVA